MDDMDTQTYNTCERSSWGIALVICTKIMPSAYHSASFDVEKVVLLFCSGTLIQCLALVTMASASIAPNPNLWLTLRPAPFVVHVPPDRISGLEV